MKREFGLVKTPDFKKDRIVEDAAKRFRMLCEYTFNITEDDGEEEPEMGDEMPQEGGMAQGGEGAPEMGGEIPQGNTPQDGGIPQEGGQMPEMGDEMPQEGEEGAPGFNSRTRAGDDMGDEMPVDDMGSDDEVIDVDDLTQSQEETEEKVDDLHVTMEKGFDKLLAVVDKLDQMIDVSTSNMEQIKQEIEKRNPTPLEKLNMRAANDSYPFNISPDDYWKEKEMESNYRIGGEGEEDAPQYTITQADIDDITDFQRISKELNDSMSNQNLKNIFGLR